MLNLKSGLASVTFRHLSAREIIDLSRQAKLDGIEWGGDVHVPQGDLETANTVGRLTRAAGLSVLCYGSYYRLGENQNSNFESVLSTANALGALLIRVWAGSQGSAETSAQSLLTMTSELRHICALAAQQKCRVSIEYHPHTFADCPQSAVQLILGANQPNLLTHWQPAPGENALKEKAALTALRGKVSHLHVFEWTAGLDRLPLEVGRSRWQRLLSIASSDTHCSHASLEFVQNDDPKSLLRDAEVLNSLLRDF